MVHVHMWEFGGKDASSVSHPHPTLPSLRLIQRLGSTWFYFLSLIKSRDESTLLDLRITFLFFCYSK